jgi:hypothetical protein
LAPGRAFDEPRLLPLPPPRRQPPQPQRETSLPNSCSLDLQDAAEISFKVKPSTPFQKVRQAAHLLQEDWCSRCPRKRPPPTSASPQPCPLLRFHLRFTCLQIFNAYCQKTGTDQGLMKFLFDSQRLRVEQTPASLEMEEGDIMSWGRWQRQQQMQWRWRWQHPNRTLAAACGFHSPRWWTVLCLLHSRAASLHWTLTRLAAVPGLPLPLWPADRRHGGADWRLLVLLLLLLLLAVGQATCQQA